MSEIRIERERILLAKIEERYTKDQMKLWGQVNLVVGAAAITLVHTIVQLFGIPPLNWFWQGVLFFVLGVVFLLYYRQYKQTKKETE